MKMSSQFSFGPDRPFAKISDPDGSVTDGFTSAMAAVTADFLSYIPETKLTPSSDTDIASIDAEVFFRSRAEQLAFSERVASGRVKFRYPSITGLLYSAIFTADRGPCDPGYISQTGMKPGCELCRADTFANSASTACRPCADGTTSPAGSFLVQQCTRVNANKTMTYLFEEGDEFVGAFTLKPGEAVGGGGLRITVSNRTGDIIELLAKFTHGGYCNKTLDCRVEGVSEFYLKGKVENDTHLVTEYVTGWANGQRGWAGITDRGFKREDMVGDVFFVGSQLVFDGDYGNAGHFSVKRLCPESAKEIGLFASGQVWEGHFACDPAGSTATDKSLSGAQEVTMVSLMVDDIGPRGDLTAVIQLRTDNGTYAYEVEGLYDRVVAQCHALQLSPIAFSQAWQDGAEQRLPDGLVARQWSGRLSDDGEQYSGTLNSNPQCECLSVVPDELGFESATSCGRFDIDGVEFCYVSAGCPEGTASTHYPGWYHRRVSLGHEKCSEFSLHRVCTEPLLICPPGWSLFDHRCYRVFLDTETLLGATEECQRHRSEITSVYSNDENAFLAELSAATATTTTATSTATTFPSTPPTQTPTTSITSETNNSLTSMWVNPAFRGFVGCSALERCIDSTGNVSECYTPYVDTEEECKEVLKKFTIAGLMFGDICSPLDVVETNISKWTLGTPVAETCASNAAAVTAAMDTDLGLNQSTTCGKYLGKDTWSLVMAALGTCLTMKDVLNTLINVTEVQQTTSFPNKSPISDSSQITSIPSTTPFAETLPTPATTSLTPAQGVRIGLYQTPGGDFRYADGSEFIYQNWEDTSFKAGVLPAYVLHRDPAVTEAVTAVQLDPLTKLWTTSSVDAPSAFICRKPVLAVDSSCPCNGHTDSNGFGGQCSYWGEETIIPWCYTDRHCRISAKVTSEDGVERWRAPCAHELAFQCAPGWLHSVDRSECVTSCPTGTYSDGIQCIQALECLTEADCGSGEILAGRCEPPVYPFCDRCHRECAECKGTAASQCTTCPPGKLLLYGDEAGAGACVSSCPPTGPSLDGSGAVVGFYSDGQVCRPCRNGCATCEALGVCTSCPAFGTLFLTRGGQCSADALAIAADFDGLKSCDVQDDVFLSAFISAAEPLEAAGWIGAPVRYRCDESTAKPSRRAREAREAAIANVPSDERSLLELAHMDSEQSKLFKPESRRLRRARRASNGDVFILCQNNIDNKGKPCVCLLEDSRDYCIYRSDTYCKQGKDENGKVCSDEGTFCVGGVDQNSQYCGLDNRTVWCSGTVDLNGDACDTFEQPVRRIKRPLYSIVVILLPYPDVRVKCCCTLNAVSCRVCCAYRSSRERSYLKEDQYTGIFSLFIGIMSRNCMHHPLM